ncbi:MAG: putative glycolipid-binding domain-containing protein [Alphaproteobacteria bacterium]|nr:putative glycolipid-binding domain-containing protein [Alphaproteobacteria bacterium]
MCLERLRRYRYESLDSDFARKIEVDADGLVVAYPGLFRRMG